MKLCLVALLLAVSSPAARAADPFAAARVSTLPNGLTVLLAPDSTATSVGIGVWVRAGSRYESPGATGATHLMERLMFMGTPKAGPGEYARRVQAEGGSFSAFTAADHTCFESDVPPAALETVLRLEADRLAALEMSPQRLEVARRTVQDERRGRADQTAVGRAVRLLYATAYAGHPYGVPVVGADEDVDRITLRQVQAYRAARYVPGRMLVTVAGAIDPVAALAAVKRTLGALPGGAVAPERPAAVPALVTRRAHVSQEAAAQVVAVGWRTPPAADPDAPALEALARVLAAGPSSRAPRLLVRAEGAPCLAAQGALDLRAAGGLLYVVTSVAPSSDTSRVELAVDELANALVREAVSADELEAAKRQIEADLLFAWQSPAGVSRALGESWLASGDALGPARRLERVRALTPADLQRVAARVLVPGGRVVVTLVPSARNLGGSR